MTPRTKHMLAGGALGALALTFGYGLVHSRSALALPRPEREKHGDRGEHEKHKQHGEENDRGEYGHKKHNKHGEHERG